MRAAVGVATLLLSAALLLLVWLRPVEVRQLVPTQIVAKREARARAGSLIDTAYPLADGGVLSSSVSSTSSTGIVTSSISSISAMEGYCAVTEGAGDCERGSSGSWQRMATLEACAARCARCARCRFVSFSRALDDSPGIPAVLRLYSPAPTASPPSACRRVGRPSSSRRHGEVPRRLHMMAERRRSSHAATAP